MVQLKGWISFELSAVLRSRLFLFCTHLSGPIEETGTSALQQELLIVSDAALGELARVLHPGKDKFNHGCYVRLFFRLLSRGLLSKGKSCME